MTSPRQRAAREAQALLDRLGGSYEHLIGMRFAINVFIAGTIVWGTLRMIGDGNPIWGIASMVAAADPEPQEARRMFWCRLVNVLVGCVAGLAFLVLGGRGEWMLPLVLSVTVLVSSYVIRIKTMWRQAPITAAVVVAGGLAGGSATIGIERGLHKVGEVIFGCFVGVAVSWLMSKLWLIQPSDQASSTA